MISGGSHHPGLFTKVERLHKAGRIILLHKPFYHEELQEAISQKLPQLSNLSSSM
jgi:hypothetical protein